MLAVPDHIDIKAAWFGPGLVARPDLWVYDFWQQILPVSR